MSGATEWNLWKGAEEGMREGVRGGAGAGNWNQ